MVIDVRCNLKIFIYTHLLIKQNMFENSMSLQPKSTEVY